MGQAKDRKKTLGDDYGRPPRDFGFHTQSKVTTDVLEEHLKRIPKAEQNNSLRFERFHFVDSNEASAFAVALEGLGGYGQVIDKSVRLMNCWMPKVKTIIGRFKQGVPEVSVQDDTVSAHEDRFFWVAINGKSATTAGIPFAAVHLRNGNAVSPVPQMLLGFKTSKEAADAQQFFLTAPQEKIDPQIHNWIDASVVEVIVPNSPEPPTTGQTHWHL